MKKILAIIMVLATALACYGQKKNKTNFSSIGVLFTDTVGYQRDPWVFTSGGLDVTEMYKKGTLKSGTYIMQTPLNPSNIREYANKKGGRITCSRIGNMYYIEYFEYKHPYEADIEFIKQEREREEKELIDSLQNEINRLKEERATIN